MKKYAFFKYFIKKRFFASGDGLGTGLGVSFLPPIWFGDEAGCMEAGVGTGMLIPAPDPPRCHI